MKIITYLLLAVIVFLGGCSNPRNYEVAKLTDEQKKELGQKLNADEGKKLTTWLARKTFSGREIPSGITVGEAIKEEENWLTKKSAQETRAKELKKEIDAERLAKQEEFAKFLTVALVSKKNDLGRYNQRWVGLDIAYENRSDRDIRGVKGVLRITDIFDDSILNINWSYDRGIPAKQKKLETGTGIEINQFKDSHMKLWNTSFGDLKSTFEILTIIFKDGTKIEAPE
jgi:hypothetical protein